MNAAIVMAALLMAQDPKPKQERELADLSLEELMRLEVTTASRKEQSLMDTAAAVAVVRGEDIRRMGVRSLPEALRMVPGTNVARIDGNKYAISVRGFSDRFANKLQVLIDGRSVYTPLFSGVFWEQQDAFLEDIDRIEVIRGPGGAVWGANAVNGVINIITKKAKDTQGSLLYAGGGSEERVFGGARHGGTSGDGLFYRAYAKGGGRDEQHDHATNDPAEDDSWMGLAGFRTEWIASETDTVTVMGEYYHGRYGASTSQAAPPPFFVDAGHEHYMGRGGHLLARWERRLGGSGLIEAQVSAGETHFESSFFEERRRTLDIDVTHRWTPVAGHDVVWGAGYRLTGDEVKNSFAVSLDPDAETDDVVSVFLQDEIALSGDSLKLTLGARAEYNDYTQFEFQPSARLSFRAHERHLLWTAASRAVRTPSRGENDIDLTAATFPVVNPFPPPAFFNGSAHVLGNGDLQAEDLLAFEAGYRVQPSDALTLDIAVFYNMYDDLQTTESRGTVFAPPDVTSLQQFDDKAEGKTYGAEVAATWQAAKGVRLYGAYTFLRLNFDVDSDSSDTGKEASERNDAKGQAFLRLSLDVVENVSVDLMGRYVGPLSNRDVDAYSESDVRVAWRALPSLELSVVGQNLLHDEHFESNNTGLGEQATEIQRGVYFMLAWQF